MTAALVALAFLTRVPVPARVQAEPELAPAVKWFPVVGAVVGGLAGTAYLLLSALLPASVAAVMAVALAVAITGAFHEDGLADTFDGLSSGRSVSRQLQIMKDSRLGTFGAVAVVLVLLARVGLVAHLDPTWATVAALAWAHAMAAAVAVAVMTVARPAAQGLAMAYLADLRRCPALVSVVTTAAAGWWVVASLWVAPVVVAMGPLLVLWWARRRIGGVTGDVLGAIQQVALVGALVAVSS